MSLVITGVIIFVASFVLGLTGFGFGLIAMGALPYLMSVREANAYVALLGPVGIIAALLPIIRKTNLLLSWPLYAGALVGIPLGVFFLVRLDEQLLRLVLGIVILIAVASQLLRSRPHPSRRNRVRSIVGRVVTFVAGTLSGALGGAFSVGGPPAVMFFDRAFDDKTEIKANLLAFFLFTIAARLPFLAGAGIVTMDSVRASLLISPAMVIGLFLGDRLHVRLPAQLVRYVVMGLLVVSATMLVLD